MKVKTAELTGAALDWAVANSIEDFSYSLPKNVAWLDDVEWVLCHDGIIRHHTDNNGSGRNRSYDTVDWSPSTDWSQGGPIIERESLGLSSPWHRTDETRFGPWGAQLAGKAYSFGPTPLIAAMRCFAASKLGDEVDVPEGLLP